MPAHRERLEAAARGRWRLDLRVRHRARVPVRPAAGHLSRPRCGSISKVHCYEIALYDDYGVEEIMIDALGFGQPLDFEPWIMLPGAIAGEFEGQIRYIADGLGVEVDEVRETYDRRPTEQPIETAFGTVEPGTCGAIRFQAIGVVDGREAIVIDHITRLARHVGTDWPIGEADLSYRIVLEGKPNFDMLGHARRSTTRPRPASRTMGSGAGAMLATAMRVVNAVPYVVDAEPGLLRSLEMPLTIPAERLPRLTDGVHPPLRHAGARTGARRSRTSTRPRSRWRRGRRAAVPSWLCCPSTTAPTTATCRRRWSWPRRWPPGPTTLPIMVAAAVLPFYEPVRLAEDIAVLDIISRGRVAYVLGVGHRQEEYDALRARARRVAAPEPTSSWRRCSRCCAATT